MSLHQTQRDILKIAQTQDLSKLSLRQIGSLIGVTHPQKVKHHLDQLEKKQLLHVVKEDNLVTAIKQTKSAERNLINIPILGEANCGKATLLAEEDFIGFLPISEELLVKTKNIFALKAVGDSMNLAEVNGDHIEDGDYVIIDQEDKSPKSGDYVVSIINDGANIKKFYFDDDNRRIVLMSESSSNYPPIFISEHEASQYLVSGKVIQVVKGFPT